MPDQIPIYPDSIDRNYQKRIKIDIFLPPSRFPLSGFLETLNWPFIFGLMATIILIGIFLISNDRAMNALSREKWWRLHPEWPGAGLLIGWFMAFVILIRFAEFVSPKLGRVVWYGGVILLPVIYIATFWWERQFIP